ncbi:MAG: hypothetical protein HRT88_14000 [Lentisphaeraceae bacterium]|nr:hypothetical protein [Lentisphaeraceae bacterium]
MDKIKIFAKTLARSNSRIKNVIVTPLKEDVIALASYYEIAAEGLGWKIKVFQNLQEARNWLKQEMCA